MDPLMIATMASLQLDARERPIRSRPRRRRLAPVYSRVFYRHPR
jgi:hypothetical protein